MDDRQNLSCFEKEAKEAVSKDWLNALEGADKDYEAQAKTQEELGVAHNCALNWSDGIIHTAVNALQNWINEYTASPTCAEQEALSADAFQSRCEAGANRMLDEVKEYFDR